MQDDMIGFDGFGVLNGTVIYNQVADKMDNFFRYVHNEDVIEIEFNPHSNLVNDRFTNFFLMSIDYDNKNISMDAS